MLTEGERAKKSGIIIINNVTYAVGLMWEPADDPDHAMKEAYSVAKSEGVEADFLCLRLSTPPQYGLGWKSVGHFVGNKPLAVAVTENVGGNYVGAFNLGDKWWFGMSRNDIILPYGDAFYDSEDEIKDAMKKILPEVSSDTIKFAPASWGIEGSRDSELEVLITNVTKIKLSPTDSLLSRYRNAVAIAILIVVAGSFVTNHVSKDLKAKQELREQRRRAIEEAKKDANPWKKNPTVVSFLNNCTDAISTIPYNISGWAVAAVECDGSKIKATLAKNGGYIYDIENKAKDLGFSLSLNAAGNNAILSRSLERIMPRFEYVLGEDLLSGPEISQQFLDLKVKVQVDVKLAGVSKNPAKPRILIDEDGNPVKLDPVYKPVNFTFKTDYPIEAWEGFLSSFPAASLKSLKLNLTNDLSWDISGNVYQK